MCVCGVGVGVSHFSMPLLYSSTQVHVNLRSRIRGKGINVVGEQFSRG